MKDQFLKIAGVKTEAAFYKKYKTEKEFFSAHPEAKKLIKKAQVGIQVDSNNNGIPDYLEGLQPIQGPQNKTVLPKVPIAQEDIYNPTIQSGLPTYVPSIQNRIDEGQAIINASPQKVEPLNISSFSDKVAPYMGAAKDLISGIGNLGAQQDEADRMRQMRKVTDLQRIASGTREEEPKRKYVKPWDLAVQPEQMFPTYGVGTNVLTAKDGAEIQNTYAPEYDLYDDLGYEPLNDSDSIKQYYYGGNIPTAQNGGGFMDFMKNNAQGFSSIGSMFSNNSAESQIGGGIFQAAGTAIGGPVVGTLAKPVGEFVGGLFNTSQGSIKRDRRAIKKNIDTIMGNQLGQSIQNQYSNVLEDGGYVSNDWNPQVIAKFDGMSAKEIYDYAHEGMDSLRSGGYLKSDYTPVSNRGLQTYPMGGELQTHWGGKTETMSYNPYLPGEGETIMFRGQSHDESDGSGRTGIGITYGNSPVEVERGEPAVKLKDGTSGEENLTVYGNLQIPNEYVPLLGDPKAKGKKFKNYIAEISKTEAKQNKLVEKSTNELNNLDVKTPFDKLKFDSFSANIMGADMKLKSIADKKKNAAALQNAINDTAEEHGLIADDLAKGKIKKAKLGTSIKKAISGTTTDETTKVPVSDVSSTESLATIPSGQHYSGKYYGKVNDETYKKLIENNPWFDWDNFNPNKKEDILKFQNEFNIASQLVGSKARLVPDGLLGEQTASAKVALKSSSPKLGDKKEELQRIVEDKKYATTPYKRSTVMDIANQILPYVRPTDQEGLDPQQLMGELYALSNNQLEPVQAQSYQPELATPYDISLQDQLNANQADFNAIQRMTAGNPAAQSILASQKYQANEKVLGDQFRANQAMKMGVYDANRNTLNDAKLKNLGIYDQQYVRQSQAKSNTKAITQAALNSIADKYAKNRLENRELGIYENLYNYRYDPSGRAINMNPLYQPNMPTVYAKQTDPNMLPVYDAEGNQTGWRPAAATPGIADNQQTQSKKFGGAVKKYAKNGNIVKAYKNI